jgi:creatinine amidohydrolase
VDHLLPTTTSGDEAQRRSDVAVLPIGSFEQHGDHLPLATDTIVACLIAREIARAYDLMLLPPITISCSHEHSEWAGTISIGSATLHRIVLDVAASAARQGATNLMVVNGHGGNYVLSNVVQEANVERASMALFPARDDWDSARLAAGMETSSREDMHGGELEVSLLLHAYPDLVGAGATDQDHDAPERPHLLISGMAAYTKSGIIGRPSAATAAKGKALLEALVERAGPHLRLLERH